MTSPAASGPNTPRALTHHIQVEILFNPGFGLLELLLQLHEVEGVKGVNDRCPA